MLTQGVKSGETPNLAPDYCHAIERMQGFRSVPEVDVQASIRRLLDWKAQLAKQDLELPAPWVFANRQDKIEFEWETAKGDLTVALESDSVCWYSLTIGDSEAEEGNLPYPAVTTLLRRLLAA